MKGRIFFKAAVSCLAKIAGCIPLIACSDDNNEPESLTSSPSIRTNFSLSLPGD
ncbi:MAG TPA: hypothetical protein GXZ56_00690 [Bacteroidales bacterium]|nr:hypothetical protein [Bacteroidales bacterium]